MSEGLRLDGELALVTGASRGIGKAIVLALGRQGATVVGTATSTGGAEAIGSYLQEAGIKGAGMVLDVASSESVDALMTAVTGQFGAVTVLVNNAGITRDNLFLRMKDDEWNAVIAVNPDAGLSSGFYDIAEAPPRQMAVNALIPEALRNLWTSNKERPEHPEPSYIALLNATLDIGSDHIRRARLAGDPPEVLLGARLKGVSIMDLHRAAECIAEGRRIVKAQAEYLGASLGL